MQFFKAKPSDVCLIESWLKKEHVRPYFYGEGLKTTLKDLDQFANLNESIFIHWIASLNNEKFGYLMTSLVEDGEPQFQKWKTPHNKAITLDLLIGDENFLGKGLGKDMIKKLLDQQFQDVDEVFIDPQVQNAKAIHIYKQVGFKVCEEFEAPWSEEKHILMKLSL